MYIYICCDTSCTSEKYLGENNCQEVHLKPIKRGISDKVNYDGRS